MRRELNVFVCWNTRGGGVAEGSDLSHSPGWYTAPPRRCSNLSDITSQVRSSISFRDTLLVRPLLHHHEDGH